MPVFLKGRSPFQLDAVRAWSLFEPSVCGFDQQTPLAIIAARRTPLQFRCEGGDLNAECAFLTFHSLERSGGADEVLSRTNVEFPDT